MKDYFDYQFSIKGGKPITKMSLKKEHKKDEPAIRDSGYPYSGIQLEFYLHHIDDEELAIQLWEFRKSFAGKGNLLHFMKKEGYVPDEDWETVSQWLEDCQCRMTKNHQAKMASEEVRQKLSDSYNREFHSKRMKEAWSDPGSREKYMQALFSEEVQTRRVQSFKEHLEDPENHRKYLEAMRTPERRRKISSAAKVMWAKATPEKRSAMNNSWHKTVKYRGYRMNKVEFKLAQHLDSKRLDWVYEPTVKVGANYYQPDFVVGKLAIECFGDFWHANPEKYERDDVLFGHHRAVDQWEKDAKRIEDLKCVYDDVVVLWEQDIICGNAEKKLKEFL